SLEPREPIGVSSYARGQHLDGDESIKLRVFGAIDLTHAACTDCGDDLIRPEPCPGRKGHRRNPSDYSGYPGGGRLPATPGPGAPRNCSETAVQRPRRIL